MKPVELLYLEHMLECTDMIEAHLATVSVLGKHHWYEHVTTREAIYHTLHTLAESSQRLPESVKQDMPGTPWPKVAGLRNILVHEYMGDIDDDIIDAIIREHLPRLKEEVKHKLKDYHD